MPPFPQAKVGWTWLSGALGHQAVRWEQPGVTSPGSLWEPGELGRAGSAGAALGHVRREDTCA